jgi:hypothetical protein
MLCLLNMVLQKNDYLVKNYVMYVILKISALVLKYFSISIFYRQFGYGQSKSGSLEFGSGK